MIPAHDPELELLGGNPKIFIRKRVGSLEKLNDIFHRLGCEAANQRNEAAARVSLGQEFLGELPYFSLVDISYLPYLRGLPED